MKERAVKRARSPMNPWSGLNSGPCRKSKITPQMLIAGACLATFVPGIMKSMSSPKAMTSASNSTLGQMKSVSLSGFPNNGHVDWFISVPSGTALGSLSFEDDSGSPMLKSIRIRDSRNNPVAQMTLTPGSSAVINLPLNEYRWTVGHGSKWHDSENQFGTDGSYFDMGRIDVDKPYQMGGQRFMIGAIQIVPHGTRNNHISGEKF